LAPAKPQTSYRPSQSAMEQALSSTAKLCRAVALSIPDADKVTWGKDHGLWVWLDNGTSGDWIAGFIGWAGLGGMGHGPTNLQDVDGRTGTGQDVIM
jgi:hypothetical protein